MKMKKKRTSDNDVEDQFRRNGSEEKDACLGTPQKR